MSETHFIYMCDMTHSYVKGLIHMCDAAQAACFCIVALRVCVT